MQKKKKLALYDYLLAKQIAKMAISPDMMWQFAHFLKTDYEIKGIKNVKVLVDAKVSINGSEFYQFTNPRVNLAATKWSYFGHQNWIMNQPNELKLSFFQ